MKILLVSDKEESYIWDYFDRERFKGVELILSCGDLKAEYLSFLVTMISAPLLYVPGNHNDSYVTKPPEGCVSIHNRLVVHKNVRIVGFGGSCRYRNGIYQYTEAQMERNIRRIKYALWKNKGFDILVTHAPAYGLGDSTDYAHRGFRAFRQLIDQYAPKYFVHGHNHLTYGRDQRIINHRNTTVINAYGYHLLEDESL